MDVLVKPLPKRLFAVGPLCLLFLLVLPFEEVHQAVPVLLVVLAFASVGLVKARWQKAMVWPFVIGALLAVPLLVGLLTAVKPEDNVETALKLLLYGAAASFVALRFAESVSLNRWSLVVFAVLIFWALDALLQYAAGFNVLGEPAVVNGRLTGLFYPSIAVGTALAHLCLLVFEPLRRHASQGWWRLAWVAVLLVVAVVVLGGSRSSWVDFLLIIGLYVLFLLMRIYLKWRWVFGLAALGAVAVVAMYQVSPSFQARAAQTALLFSGDHELINRATSSRLPIWQAAWQGFLEYPIFGFGIDYFQDFVRNNNLPAHAVNYAHFFLLDVMMITGLVGTLAYTLAYGILVVHGWQSVRNGWDYSAVLFISALVMMFPFNTHWGFYHYRPMALMWMLIALAYAFRVYEQRHSKAAG